MGEATSHTVGSESPAQLEHDIEAIRAKLTGVVSEMERRGRELVDWRLQVQRHGVELALAVAGTAVLVGGAVWLTLWLRRRREQPVARLSRLRRAVRRMIAEPEAVAHAEPNLGVKLLSALLTSATGTVAKALSERAVAPLRMASAPR